VISLPHVIGQRVSLAWRAGVDRCNAAEPGRSYELQGIGLDERERVMRLRRFVYAYHVEACPVVTRGRAPRPAEQVQEQGAAHRYGSV
jgi:hypothetical protein